jgi:hypothetical protein
MLCSMLKDFLSHGRDAAQRDAELVPKGPAARGAASRQPIVEVEQAGDEPLARCVAAQLSPLPRMDPIERHFYVVRLGRQPVARTDGDSAHAAPAPGVEVTLDGRWTLYTDEAGRVRFEGLPASARLGLEPTGGAASASRQPIWVTTPVATEVRLTISP